MNRENYIVISKKDIELLTDEAKEEIENILVALSIAKQPDIDTGAEAEVDCCISVWQPIETAPTMRQVIVAVPPITEGEGWTIGEAFLAKDDWWYWAGGTPGYHDDIEEINGTNPVAWQPLPKPPIKQPSPTLMPVKDFTPVRAQ